MCRTYKYSVMRNMEFTDKTGSVLFIIQWITSIFCMDSKRCIICLEDLNDSDEDHCIIPPCGFNQVLMHRHCLEKYENSEVYRGRCPHCNQEIPFSIWRNEIDAMESIQSTVAGWLKEHSSRSWRIPKKYFRIMRGRMQRASQERRTWRNIIGCTVDLLHKLHASTDSCIRVQNDENKKRYKIVLCQNHQKKYEIKIRIERVAFYSVGGNITSDGYEISGASVQLRGSAVVELPFKDE